MIKIVLWIVSMIAFCDSDYQVHGLEAEIAEK